MKTLVLLSLLATSALPTLAAGDSGLPLPEAPVRVFIADPASFDAALAGAWRTALQGEASGDDPVVAAFRQSQVGTKLETQWAKLASDFPWTWSQIRALKPTSLGLCLLGPGNLEAVLVIETPLAVLPAPLPAGTQKTYAGIVYHLVSRGATDDSPDPRRRAGLAWAKSGGRLFLSTSERGLRLALDAAGASARFAPRLPGLVSLDLDLDTLRHDRYFRREFPFPDGGEHGHVYAALRLDGGRLVEVREGNGDAGPSAAAFDSKGAAAAGWEPDGAGFFDALRSGLLEPVPGLSDTPVPSVGPLPAAQPATDDRYLTNLEKPQTVTGRALAEEGELGGWRGLLTADPVPGWGYLLGRDGGRRLVFAWPKGEDEHLLALCRASAERRAGRAVVASVGDTSEIRVGPDLPALALRRMGDYIWIGASAAALADAPQPKSAGDVVRWGIVDVDSVRAEGTRWKKAEGPASAERIRPFSDRVLGLLGWIPKTRSLSVERSKTAAGWSERVVFSVSEP
jgi:hypothetical protein